MATESDFAASFDEPAFRAAILNTTLMGIPEAIAERLTWVWTRDQTFVPDDPAGNPYDWTATAVTDISSNPDLPDQPTPDLQTLVVPYALEFSARPAGSANTVLGEIDTSRAVVTLLDTDYEQIKTADYAVIGDTHYRIQFDAPPVGLFGVTVWSVYLEALDES